MAEVRTMAGKKKPTKRRGFSTSSIYKYIRIAALAAPAAAIAVGGDSPRTKLVRGLEAYTGFNIDGGKFYPEALLRGWGPFVASIVTTYGIPKLAGMIRRA